jgi:hypothetical protein
MKDNLGIISRVNKLKAEYAVTDERIADWRAAYAKFGTENNCTTQPHWYMTHPCPLFAHYSTDVDESGTIDADELGKLLQMVGLPVSEESVNDKLLAADKNNDNEVNFAEFIEVILQNEREASLQ